MIDANVETEGRDVFVALRDAKTGVSVTLRANRRGIDSLGAVLAAATLDEGGAFELALKGSLELTKGKTSHAE